MLRLGVSVKLASHRKGTGAEARGARAGSRHIWEAHGGLSTGSLNSPLCVKHSQTPWAAFAALRGDGSDMVLFCFWGCLAVISYDFHRSWAGARSALSSPLSQTPGDRFNQSVEGVTLPSSWQTCYK